MTLPTFSIFLLGSFQVYYGEMALADRFKPRLQALVAYLLLHRNTPVSRQQLAFHFWPDSTEARARANVRKLVYRLRQIFPAVEDYLVMDGMTLSWRAGIPLRVDVAEFEEAVKGAEGADSAQKASSLKRAVALYKGELLPDLYDDWVLVEREQLRRRYLHCLKELATLHERGRDYSAAIPLLRQLLREEPLVEEAYRHLMRVQALRGDVGGALRTYHRCDRQLEQELGVEPAAATQAAYRRLLERREALGPAPDSRAPRQLPLVGRDIAWPQLLESWKRAAGGRSQVVVISGEAGIGKTRLSEELLRWTGRQGIPALSAACFAMEASLPLCPVADWLRSEAAGPAMAALAPRWRSEVARILPELLAADPQLEAPRSMTEPWQQQHLFLALAEAVTAAGEPLLLFLDDLHWADADTLHWLHFLVQQKKEHRFLLVGTVRSEEVMPDGPLQAWQQTLARLLPVRQIALERLAAAGTATLASSIVGHSLDERSAASLHQETEGNPLFTVEMARAGLERAPGILPEKVRSVIEIRLGQLSLPTQEVATLAAIIGRRFTFVLLQAASPQSESELLDSLDALWRRQIIREQGEHWYVFSHDKIREVAVSRLSPARRRWWHRRVAVVLEQLSVPELESVHGQIAAHWEAAGELEKAVAAYERAGEQAKSLYANDEALDAYRRALALLETDSLADVRTRRTRLLGQLGEVLLRIGRKQEAQAAFEEALGHMPAGSTEETRLHRLLGDSLGALGLFDRALAAYVRAEVALPARENLSPGPESEQWIDIQFSRLNLFYGQGDTSRIQALMDDLGPLVEQQGSPEQRVRFLFGGALVSVRLARYAPPLDKALSYSERALQASRGADLSWQTCHSHFGVGFVRLWRGEEEQAKAEFEVALGMAEEIGYEEIRLLALIYLCVLNRRRNARIPAKAFARQSLVVARAAKTEIYVAAAEANLAWVAWSSGDHATARRRGNLALELWKGSAYPFQWLAIWPLLAISLEAGELEKALNLARMLLAPIQQRLPAPVTLALESALQVETLAGAQPHLEVALRFAREHRLL